MLHLIDRILQLPIQHQPVCDYHHAVKDQLIIRIVQICQPVRQPGNAVCLATAGTVLDQIVIPRQIAFHLRQQLAHHIQLMVAREDNPLAFLALILHEDKAADDLQKTVRLQHLVPKISGSGARLIYRVAPATFHTLGM